MPNWVSNNLTITGDADKVQAVKTQLCAPFTRTICRYENGKSVVEEKTIEKTFSFWNIIHPEGDARRAYDDSISASGAIPFWYDWNCTFWGTKWDTDAQLTEHGSDHLQYVFDTAWSPPANALIALSQQHPDLHIELEWEEEQGFGGTLVFRDGEETEIESYDIPTSHAEMDERGKVCYCEMFEEKAFDDCPEIAESALDKEEAPSLN